MNDRGSRWWMRWYVVRRSRGVPVLDIAGDEWIETAFLTAWAARRYVQRYGDRMLRVVERAKWRNEHAL